jgi:glycosyltransferase involved in cell wall biosynthesis
VKVSVIIPNFNKAPYLKETLESVLNQSHQNWEAIIVDDGSTDESLSIINEFIASDNRFNFFSRDTTKKGGSVCRNIGLNKASGEYIIFLDSDDILETDCIKNRLNKVINYPLIDFAVFSGGTFYIEIGDSKSTWIPPLSKDYLKLFLKHTLPWHTTSVLWKADFLKKVQGFDESYPRLQDVELHTRALMQPGVNFKIIGGVPDFFYRIDENRKLVAPFQFVETFINAVGIYLKRISSKLTDLRYASKYHRALNGTVQAAYITIQIQYDLKQITLQQRDKLFNKLNQIHSQNLLFKIYLLGLKNNIHKIKGFNWTFKKVITHI